MHQWCSCWFETSSQGAFPGSPGTWSCWSCPTSLFAAAVLCPELQCDRYIIHRDNHIIIANRVKGTCIVQHCRLRTFLNSLSYYRTKNCCNCLLTEVNGNDFFTDRQFMKSFSTLSAQICSDDGKSDVFFNFTFQSSVMHLHNPIQLAVSRVNITSNY